MTDLICTRGRVGVLWHWLRRLRQLPLGSWGEWIALGYLLESEYDIIARNWRIGRGELDLIAYHGSCLVILEVKTRRRSPGGMTPELNLTEEKMQQLEFLANVFVGRYEMAGVSVRFDLIAIETEDLRSYEIRHYEGIT